MQETIINNARHNKAFISNLKLIEKIMIIMIIIMTTKNNNDERKKGTINQLT